MSALQQQIAEWLGLPPIRTEGQVLQIVEQQLPTSAGPLALETLSEDERAEIWSASPQVWLVHRRAAAGLCAFRRRNG